MDYSSYKNSRDAVWELLIRNEVRSLPVQIGAICRAEGVSVRYYTPTDGNDGFSTIIEDSPIIFVSENASRQRQRFTVAHELGHIILGHVGKYKLVNREPSSADNPIEQAANVFAARLLAPACVLWGLNAATAEEISRLCDISMTAAKIRAERMAELYRRGKFCSSPLERKVYAQFHDYILKHRL